MCNEIIFQLYVHRKISNPLKMSFHRIMVVFVALKGSDTTITVVTTPWTVHIMMYGIMKIFLHEMFMVSLDTGISTRDNKLDHFFGVVTFVAQIPDKDKFCILG